MITNTPASKSRRAAASGGSLSVRFVQEVPVLTPKAAGALLELLQEMKANRDARIAREAGQ